MEDINPDQLSFVFQGPIPTESAQNHLGAAIQNLRRFFPGCEVVVVSWVGTGVAALLADKAVLIEDPGDFIAHKKWWNRFKFRNSNTKRMLISTCEGIRLSTRKYCIKLRTDSALAGSGLLNLIRRYSGRTGDAQSAILADRAVFQQRLMVADAFCRNPRHHPALYHLGDIFLCGLRSDMLLLFSNSIGWVKQLESGHVGKIPWLCPEQYLWWPTLCTNKNKVLGYGFSYSIFKVVDSELSILANVEVVSLEDLGLVFSKQFDTPRTDCYKSHEFDLYRSGVGKFGYFFELIVLSILTNFRVQFVLMAAAAKARVMNRIKMLFLQ